LHIFLQRRQADRQTVAKMYENSRECYILLGTAMNGHHLRVISDIS